ncbi:MAG: hypothetical protein IPM75_09790 [Candidatus Competibacteraceae bacterium]|nr:hypothetical protein [Candidatus Competibacteraceae bacterium]MBK8963352.1 hypothetical protein [Candidatus Competibacteraceae bacterium]
MPDVDVEFAPDQQAQLERYAEQYGLSLDAAVKELVEKQKQKRKSKERPH